MVNYSQFNESDDAGNVFNLKKKINPLFIFLHTDKNMKMNRLSLENQT